VTTILLQVSLPKLIFMHFQLA